MPSRRSRRYTGMLHRDAAGAARRDAGTRGSDCATMGSPNVSSASPLDRRRAARSTAARLLENGDRLTRGEFERRYDREARHRPSGPAEA